MSSSKGAVSHLRFDSSSLLISLFELSVQTSMAGFSIHKAMSLFVMTLVLLLEVARAQDSGGLAPLPAMDAGTGFQVTFPSSRALLSMFICLIVLLWH